MASGSRTQSGDRSSGPSFQEILDTDRGAVPALLREETSAYLGSEDLPRDVYYAREVHDREVARMWSRVWQMVCREEDIPGVGDHVVYDIADQSLIVVRSEPDEIRAYHNSCLHRGTRLRNQGGSVRELRCPFHGFTWALDGTLAKVPCRWDFPHIRDEDFRLPQARVECWGGFVFANFDPDAMPLPSYLGRAALHFEAWPLAQRWKAAHVAKIFDCNWKIAIEAFLETYHLLGVHPQNLAIAGDTNAQYDVWDDSPHTSRMLQACGVSSPHLELDDQAVVDAAGRLGLAAPGIRLEEGQSSRAAISDSLRERIQQDTGVDHSQLSDAEVLDTIEYCVFPNLVLFGSICPLAYRARPHGNDTDRCIFEVMMLQPLQPGEARPKAAKLRWLSPDERFADVPELGFYGGVLDQDAKFMPRIQQGVRAGPKTHITLGNYQELQIRQMRRTLASYLNADD
jgi:phenylpropionate dioxygenase-like ring-hydroxylating dioxygenase large terminal subunit